MNVLLVEPDKILAGIYQQALVGAGHSVVWKQSAESAVHSADSQTPDVVVLELQLAEHSGVEFLYEFRSYAEWLEVPVVVLSRVAERALSGTQQLQLGVVAYLYKPRTTLQNLLRTVNQLRKPA